MTKDPKEAAKGSVDPDRMMSGEDPNTQHLDDAVHWLSVYADLTAFKADILAHTESRVVELQPDAADEIEATDITVLEAEAQRFRQRYDFWRRRVQELRFH